MDFGFQGIFGVGGGGGEEKIVRTKRTKKFYMPRSVFTIDKLLPSLSGSEQMLIFEGTCNINLLQ